MAPTWPDVGQLEEDRSAGDARMRTDVPVMMKYWIGGLVDWWIGKGFLLATGNHGVFTMVFYHEIPCFCSCESSLQSAEPGCRWPSFSVRCRALFALCIWGVGTSLVSWDMGRDMGRDPPWRIFRFSSWANQTWLGKAQFKKRAGCQGKIIELGVSIVMGVPPGMVGLYQGKSH